MRKTKKPKQLPQKYYSDELQFTFTEVIVSAEFGEDVSKEMAADINRLIYSMTEEIVIDKSYVEFPGSMYSRKFIIYDGWQNLCTAVYDTRFLTKMTKAQKSELILAFIVLIQGYLYSILDLYGYSNVEVVFKVEGFSKYIVERIDEDVPYYYLYPGKWQYWL